jgi:hypothetical protein
MRHCLDARTETWILRLPHTLSLLDLARQWRMFSKPGVLERLNHWILWRILVMTSMLLIVVIFTPRVLDLGIPAEPSPWRPVGSLRRANGSSM